MQKNIIAALLFIVAALLLSSCAKTTVCDPCTVPNDWNKFEAGKDYVNTSLALPPGFAFTWSGSEADIFNDFSDERWDYSTSVTQTGENTYRGGSLQKWYKNRLENFNAKIIKAAEYSIDSTSYVGIDTASGFPSKHFLFEQNGVAHILRPISEYAAGPNAELPTVMGIVFMSLRSQIEERPIEASPQLFMTNDAAEANTSSGTDSQPVAETAGELNTVLGTNSRRAIETADEWNAILYLYQPAGSTVTIFVPENKNFYIEEMTRFVQEGGDNPLRTLKFVRKTVRVPPRDYTPNLMRASAQAAAEEISPLGGGPQNASVEYLAFHDDGTAYVLLNIDVDGWTGVSVWKAIVHPLVEKTLLQFPEIKRVVFGLGPHSGPLQ